MWAANFGHKEIVKRLIAVGVDVNAKNKWGETALHLATRYGHKKIVESLIAAGANVNATDDWGRSALHLATINGHKEIVKRLIAKGAKAKTNDATKTTLPWRCGCCPYAACFSKESLNK
jgi:ankyrin repeat protein